MSTNYVQSHASGVDLVGTITEDKLFDRETITRKVTIAEGAAHVRGELLGQITTGGKYILSLAAAEDGSEDPSAVLLHDVDASDGDAEAIVAIAGRFATGGVTFGTGHTAASTDVALRQLGIFLENAIG